MTAPTSVLPATVAWAYPDLESDYRAGANVWREVSEDFYWQALEVMPPTYVRGGFLVGEPWNHDARGQAVCAGFAKVGGRHFARMSTARDFPDLAVALYRALQDQGAARKAKRGAQ